MKSYLSAFQSAIESLPTADLSYLLTTVRAARAASTTVYVCGNGGSHAVAVHWGVDLLKQGQVNIHTLGTNPAVLTAYANDVAYELGLSTELSCRGRPGDVLVCLSCSGSSRNIAATLREARKLRMHTFLLTGTSPPHYPEVTVIRVNSTDYGVLEDMFSVVGHWLTRELHGDVVDE